MCAAEPSREPARFGTVVIVGGGCYGSYYVRQLARAAQAGAVRLDTVLVVDRDPECAVARDRVATTSLPLRVVTAEWATFFDAWLGRAAASGDAARARDAIVPSPLMPHLLFDWIAARMRARSGGRAVHSRPLDGDLPVPWQRTADDGTRYASFATWMCPINCIEPARCPHTRAARDWSMPVAVTRYVRDAEGPGPGRDGPFVFHCTHRVYGVGMIDVADVLAADGALARLAADGPVDAIVGTMSHCHGAIGRLEVEEARGVGGRGSGVEGRER